MAGFMWAEKAGLVDKENFIGHNVCDKKHSILRLLRLLPNMFLPEKL